MAKQPQEGKLWHYEKNHWILRRCQTPRQHKQRCPVRFCSNLRQPRNDGRTKGRHLAVICNSCKSRQYRANYPDKDIFRIIRDRAKRRGQVFHVTLAYLETLPRWQEYVLNRGREAEKLQLDRKRPALGYVPGNLKIITSSENASKRHTEDPY